MPEMPAYEKTSVPSPGPRSNTGSQGYGPEFVPTAAGQGLLLLTHIIRAFGISFALVINGIVFIPFFLFGILPLLIKERLSKAHVQTQKASYHRNQNKNGDVSPLLLSADASSSYLAPFSDGVTEFSDICKDFAQLSDPMTETHSNSSGSSIHEGSKASMTQPGIPDDDSTYSEVSDCSSRPHSAFGDEPENRDLAKTEAHLVEPSHGIPGFDEGVTSGCRVLDHNFNNDGSTIIKRAKITYDVQNKI